MLNEFHITVADLGGAVMGFHGTPLLRTTDDRLCGTPLPG